MDKPKSVFAGQELRIVPLDSREANYVLMPHNFRLPKDTVHDDEDLETAARRIGTEKINQPFLTSVARLTAGENVQGYVVEASTGKSVDLRAGFATRAFALDFLLKDADEKPKKYDPIDVALLQSFFDQTYRI
ncbi:hypothetical protein HY312_03405 [Candidatus Saccharibacteria bacterium]|nr:hypothetical protein [Candidatus Saccharibacteria bacterium]